MRVFSPRHDKDAIKDVSSQSRIARFLGISSRQWLHESDCDCGDRDKEETIDDDDDGGEDDDDDDDDDDVKENERCRPS